MRILCHEARCPNNNFQVELIFIAEGGAHVRRRNARQLKAT